MAGLQLSNTIAALEVLGARDRKFELRANRYPSITQIFTHDKYRVWTYTRASQLRIRELDAPHEHFPRQ